MQVSVEATEGLEKRMTIEVPADKIDGEVQKRLKSMQSSVKMQGFRPGKVPMSIVQKRYGGQVLQEVTGEVVSSSFYEAVSKESLKPAGMPKIEDQARTDNGLKFTAVFEIFPEVEVKGIEEVKIEKPVVEISDTDIDNMIEKLQKQRVEWIVVERASQKDDRITCDYTGTIDGETFAGGEGTDMPLVLGSNSMITGFEDGMIGSEAGQTVEMDLQFPENYHKEDLAGKDVHFSVTVKSVEESKLPEINEEFITAFGVEEGGVDAFRDELKANMKRELDRTIKTKVKTTVMDAILAANEFDIPKSMIQAESSRIAEQMNEQMKMSQGKLPATMQPFEANQFEDQAKRRVALGLILSEIVKVNELKASADKVRAEIETIASSYEQPQDVVNWYYHDKDRLTEVESMILEEEVVDWVLERAQVTDNITTFDDVMKDIR